MAALTCLRGKLSSPPEEGLPLPVIVMLPWQEVLLGPRHWGPDPDIRAFKVPLVVGGVSVCCAEDPSLRRLRPVPSLWVQPEQPSARSAQGESSQDLGLSVLSLSSFSSKRKGQFLGRQAGWPALWLQGRCDLDPEAPAAFKSLLSAFSPSAVCASKALGLTHLLHQPGQVLRARVLGGLGFLFTKCLQSFVLPHQSHFTACPGEAIESSKGPAHVPVLLASSERWCRWQDVP